MTIKNLIQYGARELVGLDSGRLDAELLLAHVLKKDRTYLMAHDDEVVGFLRKWRFKRLVAKRKKHMPLAYLTGEKEFYGLRFKVNRHVLIPRPDTEILVQSVLSYMKPGDQLLDVGTGTACIPIAVMKNTKNTNAVATDISGDVLGVAQENINTHGLAHRIQLIHSSLLEKVPLEFFEDKNLIVTANLPYVPEGYEINEEAKYEPHVALFGGEDGLELYRKLLVQLGDLMPRAIFLECYEFQMAMLAGHLPGYHLKRSENMLGQARMMMLERLNY